MTNFVNEIKAGVFLETLDEKQYQLLLSYGREKNVIAETVILQQGKISNTFYILFTGKLGIRNNYTGSINHATVEVGDMIGDTSLIEGVSSKVSVIAIENSTLFAIPIESLKKLIEQAPKSTVIREFFKNAEENAALDPTGLGEVRIYPTVIDGVRKLTFFNTILNCNENTR